jgi:hypothetical protein
MKQRPITDATARPNPRHRKAGVVANRDRFGLRRKPIRDTRNNAILPGNTVSGSADMFPRHVTIKEGKRSRTERWARIIVTDEAVYIATTRNKGNDVISVEKHTRPEGDRTTTGPHAGHWGNLSWTGCGCGNSWNKHTQADLISRAKTVK